MHAVDGLSLPQGSRLSSYMGVSNGTAGPSAATSMSSMSVNVPSFVPQFAQMHNRSEVAGSNGGSYPSLQKPPPEIIPQDQGGTTYYVQHEPQARSAPVSMIEEGIPKAPEKSNTPDSHTIVNTDGCFTYQAPAPHVGKFRPKFAGPGGNYRQFISPDLKIELSQRQLAMKARPNPESYPDLPQTVEHLRDLVPLEPPSLHQRFRLTSPKALSAAEPWKKLNLVPVVCLRDVFSTRAFGDHSLLFAYDYYPMAETLKSRHFGGSVGMVDAASNTKLSSIHAGPSMNVGVEEALLWSYIMQLTGALRTIHAAGLAARCVDLSKIIVHGEQKVMLAVCGSLDVLSPEPLAMQHQQVEDLVSLGRVILELATLNMTSVKRDWPSALGYVTANYSPDLKNFLQYLLVTPTPRRHISDIMPMIGARFYNLIEGLQLRNDLLESELARELENGRLFRLLAKLNTIVERQEHNMDSQWSETGDRFLIKLFRDYIFHQVMESGKPWLDMAHIVQCLNKLDAGASEKIELVSRDGDNVIIVSYLDLRRCIDTAFGELNHSTVVNPARH